MDESKLLEECINIPLTPLQAILLSKTLIVTNTLLEFLRENDCIVLERYRYGEKTPAPTAEQTGQILIKSALSAMMETREKLWEIGKKDIGETVPEEFTDVVEVYSMVIRQVANEFVELLREKDN